MSLGETGNPFFDVDEIPNPHRPPLAVQNHGVDIPEGMVFGVPQPPRVAFDPPVKETTERIPIDIKDELGRIRIEEGLHGNEPIFESIPIQPCVPINTFILATPEGVDTGMEACEDADASVEDEEILEEAVMEPQEYVSPACARETLVIEMADEVAGELEGDVESILEAEESGELQPTHRHFVMGEGHQTFNRPKGEEVSPAWDSDHFPTADTYLKDMQETYAECGKVYGNSCLRAGKLLKAMIPEGVVVETEQDYAIMAVLGIMSHKLCRALNPQAVRAKLQEGPEGFRKHLNLSELGHRDSIHDLAVYTAIWEELFIRSKGSK